MVNWEGLFAVITLLSAPWWVYLIFHWLKTSIDKPKAFEIIIDLGDVDVSKLKKQPTVTFNPPPAKGTPITISYKYGIQPNKKEKK